MPLQVIPIGENLKPTACFIQLNTIQLSHVVNVWFVLGVSVLLWYRDWIWI